MHKEAEICGQVVTLCLLSLIRAELSVSPNSSQSFGDVRCCLAAMCQYSKSAALTVLQRDKPYHSLPVSLSVLITEVNNHLG